jgi:hypothetical protein
MNKEFIPYEQALALKELGFDEPCLMYYDYSWTLVESGVYECKAPLYQQAFRWFREKYQLHSTITSISQESWQWHIQKPGQQLGKLYDEDYYTYEEAELACLEKLIEIVESKSE